MRKRIWIAVLILGVLPAPAMAAEGWIPIYERTLIDQPGKYVLVTDLFDDLADPQTPIIITADKVELDLNGHEIGCTGLSSGAAAITISAVDEVTVRNGIVGTRLCGQSVSSGARHVRVIDVVSHAPLVLSGEVVEVIGNRIEGRTGLSQRGAIDVRGTFVGTISDNVVDTSRGHGIYLEGMVGGRVENNTVIGIDGGSNLYMRGIYVQGSGVSIAYNRIGGCDGPCSRADGILVVGDGNRLEGNLVAGFAGNGFAADGSDNLVRGNVAVQSGGNGFEARAAGTRNLIDGNHLSDNGEWGYLGATQSAYRDNVLLGNTSGPLENNLPTDGGGNIQ